MKSLVNASPISCRDALQSINPARSLAAGYGAVERNRTPHSVAQNRRVGQAVFVWGIVSRFAKPSQGWIPFFPHATFVVSRGFASSRQIRLLGLPVGRMALRASSLPPLGAPRAATVSVAFSALGFAWRLW